VVDDGWLREFISEFLRWRSYNVIEAKDGLEGWELAISNLGVANTHHIELTSIPDC